MTAKHIQQDYLRKKGVNITTGKFAVICKNCGFASEYGDIENVNQIRIDHIHQNNCPSESVKLEQHEDDKETDDKFVQHRPSDTCNRTCNYWTERITHSI